MLDQIVDFDAQCTLLPHILLKRSDLSWNLVENTSKHFAAARDTGHSASWLSLNTWNYFHQKTRHDIKAHPPSPSLSRHKAHFFPPFRVAILIFRTVWQRLVIWQLAMTRCDGPPRRAGRHRALNLDVKRDRWIWGEREQVRATNG